MNALTVPDHAASMRYDDIERLAASIAKSGLFGIKTADQAVALMMISHAEGRHPALAARDYDIIQGRPAKKAEAMLRDFIQGGGKVKWHRLDDACADATFSHPAGGEVRIVWDMERANKAQLAGKEMYKKFPRQMLRNRTVSEGIRTVFPLATSGMYVPEEAVDFTGTTIDHQPEPQRQEPPATPAPHPTAHTGVVAPEQNGNGNGNGGKRTMRQRVEALGIAFRDAHTRAEVNRIMVSKDFEDVNDIAQGAARSMLDEMTGEAMRRTAAASEPPPAESEMADAADPWAAE